MYGIHPVQYSVHDTLYGTCNKHSNMKGQIFDDEVEIWSFNSNLV